MHRQARIRDCAGERVKALCNDNFAAGQVKERCTYRWTLGLLVHHRVDPVALRVDSPIVRARAGRVVAILY